ncbi:MAG: QueT transporter family protein, partial [Candidatus Latescibacteria bacterium]|nr:QueT transporter family protein [Candidatus Latescibacterota bacterium]
MKVKYLTRVGLIGALYAALTLALAPISYGPLQVRVSEALTVLPYVMPASVWGLFIGCFLANWLGGLGPWDIFGGSLLTLLAAILTYWVRKTGKPWLAPLPPVLVNAFGVSAYLQLLFEPPSIALLRGLSPYFLFVISV